MNKHAIETLEHTVHEMLKCLASILQTKRHTDEFKEAKQGHDGGL